MIRSTHRKSLISPRAALAGLVAILLWGLLGVPVVLAQSAEPRLPDAARRGLAERDFPWYDADNDRLRRIDVDAEDRDVARNRSSDWSGEPGERSQREFDLGMLGGFRYVLNVLLWGVLICLLAGLLYLLIRFLLKRERTWSEEGAIREEATETVRADAERFDSLPFELGRPQGDLLDETRQLYEQGEYRRAIVYLFSYQLMHLDRHQMIHLAKGKTNRQYLRELRWRPSLSAVVHQTMVAFEDVFFGDHALTREEFEACWKQVETFHHHVEQAAEQTTAA